MKVECVINGQVRMIIYPENEMEEMVIAQLMKQSNSLTEIRTTVSILGKQITHGLLIESYSNNTEKLDTSKPGFFQKKKELSEPDVKDDPKETKEM